LASPASTPTAVQSRPVILPRTPAKYRSIDSPWGSAFKAGLNEKLATLSAGARRVNSSGDAVAATKERLDAKRGATEMNRRVRKLVLTEIIGGVHFWRENLELINTYYKYVLMSKQKLSTT
jgi:hypothetical protein